MPYEPFERVALGRTGLTVTRLGFGAASIAGLFTPVADADAVSVVDHAWEIGVRVFDCRVGRGPGVAWRKSESVRGPPPNTKG